MAGGLAGMVFDGIGFDGVGLCLCVGDEGVTARGREMKKARSPVKVAGTDEK